VLPFVDVDAARVFGRLERGSAIRLSPRFYYDARQLAVESTESTCWRRSTEPDPAFPGGPYAGTVSIGGGPVRSTS
jgi:hypothetical protein